VFARKGWSTTIADIAEEAQVSQGLVYHYFANKEAVFNELMTRVARPEFADLRRRLISGDTPTQKLESLISSILEARQRLIHHFGITAQLAGESSLSRSRIEMMRRLSQAVQDPAAEENNLQEMMKRRYQKVHDTIVQLIAEGQQTGEFAADPPDKLALLVLSCIHHLTTLALAQPEKYRQHYPYTEIIMRMVKPGSPASSLSDVDPSRPSDRT
jgi:AcrR family transcriptional regulator